MKDLITSILGRKHCGWCTLKSDTFLEKVFPNRDTLGGKIYWSIIFWEDTHIPIWKLGQKWHWRFHVSDEDKIPYDPCEGHS